MKRFLVLLVLSLMLMLSLLCPPLAAQQGKAKKAPDESDYYRMISFPLPDDAVLEVGGLDWRDRQKQLLLVCTRRGDLWQLETSTSMRPLSPASP